VQVAIWVHMLLVAEQIRLLPEQTAEPHWQAFALMSVTVRLVQTGVLHVFVDLLQRKLLPVQVLVPHTQSNVF